DLIRVMMTKGERPEVKNTWLVAPGMDDVPLKGRDRFDLSPFSLPEYKVQEGEQLFVVETEVLKLQIQLDGFQITWFAKDGSGNVQQIAADRSTQ
ncbi:alpha-glucosidase, partial [Bacillus cereus]